MEGGFFSQSFCNSSPSPLSQGFDCASRLHSPGGSCCHTYQILFLHNHQQSRQHCCHFSQPLATGFQIIQFSKLTTTYNFFTGQLDHQPPNILLQIILVTGVTFLLPSSPPPSAILIKTSLTTQPERTASFLFWIQLIKPSHRLAAFVMQSSDSTTFT